MKKGKKKINKKRIQKEKRKFQLSKQNKTRETKDSIKNKIK